MSEDAPSIAVLSVLFPHPGQPDAGLFIRERMFRVGQRLPLLVVSPVPWFPLQGIVRRWRPRFRPPAPRRESQGGFEVYHPRFLSVPGILKSLDGRLMALGALPLMTRLRQQGRLDLIDAHFAYPDGYAASLLGKWLGVPFTITLRGTEVPHARDPRRRQLMLQAVARASRVFSVSESLRRHLGNLGADTEKIQVIGNGVDTSRFEPVPREEARRRLGLPLDAKVLITVGGLVERKGFHRVLEVMPSLAARFPGLVYLLVGGAGPEGDWGERLREQARDLGLGESARFLGPVPPDELKVPLSAADVFVLATRNEGWANVLLEAMACGLPVVATDVGGNREVLCEPKLGRIVPFNDRDALRGALAEVLASNPDREGIIAHARANQWDRRIDLLEAELRRVGAGGAGPRTHRDAGSAISSQNPGAGQ